MNNRKLFHIRKTDHCLERQDQRDIPDELLAQIFEKTEIEPKKRLYVIVKMAFIESLAFNGEIPFRKNKKAGLILRFSGKCLTTCYFCEDPEYLFKEHPKFEFKIIE